jgi:hypothetical protein
VRSPASAFARLALLAALAASSVASCEVDEGLTDPPPPVYAKASLDDDTVEIYDPDNLPRFDLEIDAAGLAALRTKPREPVRATFRHRDEVLVGVGVRLKGEYSFRPIDGKPSFRIKFDEFTDGQKFRGLSKLVLNNTVQDPSFLSERMAYGLFRAVGMPAPRANSALVYVNGAFYGLYTNVEAADKALLSRWFASTKGNLYEENGVDFVAGAEKTFELETNEKKNDRRDLAGLVAALERATPADFMEVMAPHVDVPRLVRYCALESLVGHEDGYCFGPGKRNNFRIYNDPTTRQFTFLPSGMDRALRPWRAPALVHAWVPPAEVYGNPFAITGLLPKKCLANAACGKLYAEALAELTAAFEAADLPGQIERATQVIRAAVTADGRKELDSRYFDYALQTMRDYVQGRPASIRAALQTRR